MPSGASISRRHFLRVVGGFGAAWAIAGGGGPRGVVRAEGTLRALTWPGYDEPGVIGPFESRWSVKVQTRTYNDSGVALSMLQQSAPGEWDVAVIDSAYVARAARSGLLEPLPEDVARFSDFVAEYRTFQEGRVDGKLYSVPTKFGYFGLVYNTSRVDPAAVRSYDVLFDPRYKGRIAQYAWYLPNIATMAIYLGYPDPFRLDSRQLGEVKRLLIRLKPQVVAVGWEQETQQALANGTAWMAFPAGEFIYGNLLADGHPVEFTIPEPGGTRWTESAAIVRGTRNRSLAEAWVRYFGSPEGQARIAMAQAYRGIPPNGKAAQHLTRQQLRQIKWDQVEAFVARTRLNVVPENNDEWLKVWDEYLAA